MSTYPRMTYGGISILPQTPVAIREQITPSTLTPLFLIISNQGSYKETLVNNMTLAKEIYGTAPFDRTSAFYNHQSVALESVLTRGGSAVVKRLDLGGTAASASLYLNNEDYVAVYLSNLSNGFPDAVNLITINAIDYGSGTNIDVVLSHPSEEGGLSQELSDLFINDKSFPVIVSLYRRTRTTRTRIGRVLVALGTSIAEYDITKRLSPKYGIPLQVEFDFAAYRAAQNLIYNIIFNNDPLVDKTQLDVLFGLDIFGQEQYAFPPQSIYPPTLLVNGGTDNLPLTVSGSPDKLQTLLAFDQAALAYLQTSAERLQNRMLYPFRSFWDTGFTMSTKKVIKQFKAKRPELVLVVADYSVADFVEDGITPPSGEISCSGATSVTNGTILFCNAQLTLNETVLASGDPYDIAAAYGDVSVVPPPWVSIDPAGVNCILDLGPDDIMREYEIWFNGSSVYRGILGGMSIDPQLVALYQIYENGGSVYIKSPIEDQSNPFSLFIVPLFDNAVGCLPVNPLSDITFRNGLSYYENGTVGITYGYSIAFPGFAYPNPQGNTLVITQFLSPQGGTPTSPFGVFLNLEGVNGAITFATSPTFIVQPSDSLADIVFQINEWAFMTGKPVSASIDPFTLALVVVNSGNSGLLTFGTLNAQYVISDQNGAVGTSQTSIYLEGEVETIEFGLTTYVMSSPVFAYASNYGKNFVYINQTNLDHKLRFTPIPLIPPSSYQRIDWVFFDGDPPNPNLSQGYDSEVTPSDTIVCIIPLEQA